MLRKYQPEIQQQPKNQKYSNYHGSNAMKYVILWLITNPKLLGDAPVNERRTLGLKATILKTISIVNNVVNTTFR